MPAGLPRSTLASEAKKAKQQQQHHAASSSASTSIQSTSQQQPPQTAHRVPIDVLTHILNQYASFGPRHACNTLLISKQLQPALEAAAYSCISLFSIKAIENFANLLKDKPDLAKRVRALWIAPRRQDSDLIQALAPPASNNALEARQRHVQSLVRQILRSCRRLRHLALDGGFLTPQSATSFGTACKPVTLLCVNPHSFLGHFSAPLFRTTLRRLEVVDTTLAVEEVDEIRQMQGLRHFLWTSPRANSDVTRDVSVLLRILAPRTHDTSPNADAAFMDALMITGNAAPDKARQNAHLQSICTATSQTRAAALAASFKKVVESVELRSLGGDDDEDESAVLEDAETLLRREVKAGGFYVDSAGANSSSLHRSTGVELRTQALSSLVKALNEAPSRVKYGRSAANNEEGDGGDESDDDMYGDDEIVEEWEALRDVVCQRHTTNSTSSSRFFAGLGSGSASVLTTSSGSAYNRQGAGSSGPGTPRVVNALGGSNSGVSTPGWGVSRPASPHHHDDAIDGGRALQRIWRRWQVQISTGELDMY